MLSSVEQCHWYLMSVRMKRTFLLVMLRAQKPTCLIAGTSVINLALGVSVCDINRVKMFIILIVYIFSDNENRVFGCDVAE